MNKTTGFLKYQRQDVKKIEPSIRLKNWNEQIIRQDEGTIKKQAARCMDCGIPFCHSGIKLNNMFSGCPLHNLIPEFNELVFEGKWEEAYHKLIRTSPFPEFTARVCPAPCEGSCTNGLHYEPVTIKNIEYEIIERAFENNLVKPYKGPKKNSKIAIIGSGPAGLSTAYYLNQYGYQCDVYEKEDRIGGLLMYGIPSMKLEKEVIKRRLDILSQSGVNFYTNKEFGKDIILEDIKETYDAVVLAIGAETPRNIEVENNEKIPTYFAMDYLKKTMKNLLNKEEFDIDTKDMNVIVIGGGDTATDCIATAIRQEAASVTQLEILPSKPKKRTNPWPEFPNKLKVDYGQEEAIYLYKDDPRIYETLINKTIESTVQTSKVKWKKINGKYQMDVTQIRNEYPCDIIIIAAGFIGPNKELLDALELSSKHYNTELESVFQCGDMRTGQSLVVQALEEGKQVALEVQKFLEEDNT